MPWGLFTVGVLFQIAMQSAGVDIRTKDYWILLFLACIMVFTAVLGI